MWFAPLFGLFLAAAVLVGFAAVMAGVLRVVSARRWLRYTLVGVMVLLLLGATTAFAVLVHLSLWQLLPYITAIAWCTAAGLAIGVVVCTVLALRTRSGRPAGADWPIGRLWAAVLVLLLAAAGLSLFRDAQIHQRAAEIATRDQQTRRELVVAGRSAEPAALYQSAFQATKAHQSLMQWREDQNSVPPTFPKELRSVLELAYQASEAPAVDWGVDPLTADFFSTSYLGQMREIAYVLHWHAVDSARSGNFSAAVHSIGTMQSMARQIGGDCISLIELLVAFGVDGLAKNAVLKSVDYANSDDDLVGLAITDGWYTAALDRALRGEQAMFDQGHWAVMTGDFRLIDGPASSRASRITAWLFRLLLGDAELQGMEDRFSETFAYARRLEIPPETTPPKGTIFAAMLAPVYRSPIRSAISGHCEAALARTAIAVKRYQLRTGAWPVDLKALVNAGLLPEVPTDSFSGKPLQYLLRNDAAVVYSVGVDGVDDGGEVDTTDFGVELHGAAAGR